MGGAGPSLGGLETGVDIVARACLDHVLVLSERHLRRILTRYFAYYHGARTHFSLDKDAPGVRPIQRAEVGPIMVDVWFKGWSDLAHFEVIPVRTSAEAAKHIAERA